jgi:hypothetical protein
MTRSVPRKLEADPLTALAHPVGCPSSAATLAAVGGEGAASTLGRMRQLLSWRFLAAVVAVGVLALVAVLLQSGQSGFSGLDSQAGVETRRVDTVSLVTAFQQEGFGMSEHGTVEGRLGLAIQVAGEARVVEIFPGTPGVVECEELVDYGCVVLVQALGDTVVWFALVPINPLEPNRFFLPAIVDLQDGYAHLANGWELPYTPVIDRACDPGVASLSEFIDEHGTDFRSVYDLREQAIVAVDCPEGSVTPPADTSVATT